MLFENKMLRRIFGPKREELTREWTILHTEVLNDFYSSPLTISRDSSVGIALGYGLDDRGSRVRFPAGAVNFSLYHCVQNGSGASPIQWVRGDISLGVRRPGHAADH
jgi:hypothetical protein